LMLAFEKKGWDEVERKKEVLEAKMTAEPKAG
jgi:hypothetical protein